MSNVLDGMKKVVRESEEGSYQASPLYYPVSLKAQQNPWPYWVASLTLGLLVGTVLLRFVFFTEGEDKMLSDVAPQIEVVAPPVEVVTPQFEHHISPPDVSRQSPADSVVDYDELPEDVKNELSELKIVAHIYAEESDMRSVIVNGQMFQEGRFIDDKVFVERIEQQYVVFAFSGHHFRIWTRRS